MALEDQKRWIILVAAREYGSQIVAKFNNKNSYQNQQLDT